MKYILILAIFFSIYSCDKIEGPYIENNTQDIDTTKVLKKILVEDFTGHTCGNCPRAHEALQELHEQYGEQVIGVGIHIGWFAQVGGAYTYDFRTAAGADIDAAFSIDGAGLPQGMINRRTYQGNVLIPHGSWSTFVGEILNEEAKAKITISNTYNSADSSFSSSITSVFLDDITDELSLVVYLVEDSIVKCKKIIKQILLIFLIIFTGMFLEVLLIALGVI